MIETAPGVIRVLVVDDQALLRRSMATIIASQPDLAVVGESSDGRQAIAQATTLLPDVVLMDINMPGDINGVEATRAICAHPELAATRICILTMFDDDQYVFQALRAGASGYLLKDTTPEGVIDSIRALHNGRSPLSPGVLRTVAAYCPPTVDPTTQLPGLTSRQTQILRLIAEGLSNEQIERELFISRSTLKSHITALLQRLGARDRAQLVIAAYEGGLVRRRQR